MAKKIFSLTDFFQSFNQKEAFYENIMDEKDMTVKILNRLFILILFSFIYGIFMGCFNGFLQAISSGIKVPILFTLIILICFPAFFVIQSILGSKMSILQMISVILSGFVMTATILVSFAPIIINDPIKPKINRWWYSLLFDHWRKLCFHPTASCFYFHPGGFVRYAQHY